MSIARNKKKHSIFVQVPLELAAVAAKASDGQRMLVWIVLLYLSWKNKSNTVVLSNQVLAKYGISREMKRRAIAGLARAGLITVAGRGRGRSLQVTLTQRLPQ